MKQPLSHKALGSSHPLATLAIRMLGATPESVYLSPAPRHHAAPLLWTRDLLVLGATVVIMERFDAVATLEAIERFGVTHAEFVPTMFSRLLALELEVRSSYGCVDSLRAVVHAAAPCPEAVKRAMLDWWGPIVHEYYSGTEGNGLCWATPHEWLAHPGTVGRARQRSRSHR